MDLSKNNYIQHAIAVFLILIASLVYFLPETQGKKILSHDQLSSVAAAKETLDYREKGETILWSSRIFSGMPLFQTAYRVTANQLFVVYSLNKLLPKSMWLWFQLMIGFYIALSLLGYNLSLRIIGALAFGLSTWFMLSIEAGHSSKIMVLAFIPPLLASILLTYRGKWLFGGVLTALFASLALMGNHPQIIYYTLFFVFIIFVYHLIKAIKNKSIPSFAKRTLILAGFGVLGAIPSSTKMYMTYDYAKETIRGGKSELTKEKKQSTGLDLEYAMQYSYGKAEALNLVIPGFAGSGAKLDEGSALFDDLRKKGVSKKQALDYLAGIPVFYGDPPINTGPSYLGAGIIFLFVLMMFMAKTRFRWVLLSVIIMALFFAWGRHFATLNELMFDHFPLFNKFRTPSMWLSMAMIAVVFGAIMGLKIILDGKYDADKLKKSLFYTGGILGGFVVVVYLFKSSFTDFAGPYDSQLEQNGIDIATLIEDRISLLNADILRTLVILGLMFGVVWMIMKQKLKTTSTLVYVIFAAIIVGDLWTVDKRYLNEDDFQRAKSFESSIKPTGADQQILADKNGHYRVFNTTVSSFNDNITSYFHKSTGGYSAAKLIRYQDLIERHLTQGSMNVFSMLNTRYFIVGQPGQEQAQQNPNALGNAWFVSEVQWAKDADEEMAMLKDFNPARTVVIDQRFKTYLDGFNTGDGRGSVTLSKFHPDNMEYQSESATDQFAVFSEIWYKGNEDWKAYIDGQEAEFIRVNYLLRGLKIPAGKHKVEFKFYPEAHYIGSKISFASSVLIIIMVLGLGVMVLMKKRLPGMTYDSEDVVESKELN